MMSLAVTRIGASDRGHQIAVWITWMTDAHVSVGIEYALLGKDTIGRNKVLDERRIDRAARGLGRLCGGGTASKY
jgi:hypothetical protein